MIDKSFGNSRVIEDYTDFPDKFFDLLEEKFGKYWLCISDEKLPEKVKEETFEEDFSFSFVTDDFLKDLKDLTDYHFSESQEKIVRFRLNEYYDEYEELSKKLGIFRTAFRIDIGFAYRKEDKTLFFGWTKIANTHSGEELLEIVKKIGDSLNLPIGGELFTHDEELLEKFDKLQDEHNSNFYYEKAASL